MGSDATVYVFDHERYQREVVPIVTEWLRSLSLEDPLDQAFVSWDTRQGDQPVAGTELLAHSTTLGADLRFLGAPNTGEAWFDKWPDRRCISATCLSRSTCPWHQEDDARPYTANSLIEWLIARTGCLGERAFVGRTTTVGDYASFLDDVGYAPGSRLRELLDALGSRGRVIGYKWAGSAEGIHGWLDADENRELAAELDTLDLPDVGGTVAEVEGDLKARHEADDRSPFESWSLAVVRVMARLARDAELGLLWGNDMSGTTREEVDNMRAWYEGLTDKERNRPV